MTRRNNMRISRSITIDKELLDFAKRDAGRKLISVSSLMNQLLEEHKRNTEREGAPVYPRLHQESHCERGE